MEPTKAFGSIGRRSPSLSSSISDQGIATTRTISSLPSGSSVARLSIGPVSPASSFDRLAKSPRARNPGPSQGLGGPAPERVRCLEGVPAGDLGRGVAHVAGELFERHPVVGQEGRRAVADPVAAEVGE